MENLTNRKRILLGYGDIAQRLGKICLEQKQQIVAVRRTKIDRAGIIGTDIKRTGLNFCATDATDPEALQPLVEGNDCDIVVTLTPDNYSEQGYRDAYLACAAALAKVLPEFSPNSRVVFVSSTSVYGQDSGEWVDETSECRPKSATAKVLVEAEQTIASAGFAHCNLRFSGIYGPGRTRLITSVQEGRIAPSLPVRWTNRIHADDCAGVINFLLSLPAEKLPDTVIGTDNEHVPKRLVQKYIARLMDPNVELPSSVQTGTETGSQAAPQKGKRCSNGLLRDLGYQFKYPSYKDGFAALIESEY